MRRSTENDMHLEVESSHDTGRELPCAFHFHGRRVEVVTIVDQWFGPDYRYCKVKGDDGAVYILRVVDHSSDWQITLFSSTRIQDARALSGT
ncbi:MAG TPA: hypothetical protein VIV34_12200 [Pseudolabrys sp.]